MSVFQFLKLYKWYQIAQSVSFRIQSWILLEQQVAG